MALYDVRRSNADDVLPGEFISAYVVAAGTAQAREAVAHMDGVTKKNVTAERVVLTDGVSVLSAYFDESPTLADASPDPAEWVL